MAPLKVTKLSVQPLGKGPLQEPDLLVTINMQQIDDGSLDAALVTERSLRARTSAGSYPTTGLSVQASTTSQAQMAE